MSGAGERSLGMGLFAALAFLAMLVIAPLLVSTGFTNSVGAGPFVAKLEEPRLSDGRLVVAFRVGNEGSVAGAAVCAITSLRSGEAGLREIIVTDQIAPGEIIEARRILEVFDGELRPLAISCGGSRPWAAATTIDLDPPSPTPSATASPNPSADPSANPSGEPSVEPSGSPEPSASPGEALARTITAMGIAFDLAEIRVDADTEVALTFINDDAGIPHNVAIHEGSVGAVGRELWRGAVFPGVATEIYDVPAFAAGSYAFICTVHPNMVGAWIAE